MEAEDTSCNLSVSDDKLSVLLDCIITKKTLPALVEEIVSELESMGIANVPSVPELQVMLVSIGKKRRRVRSLALIRGTPPVQPKEGRIIWGGDYFATGFYVDEVTGKMDYRRPKGQPGVVEGELIARIVPPAQGRPGVDVFGNEIPVEEPDPVEPRVGANVEVEHRPEGTCFIATIGGRVHSDGDTIWVDEMFVVNGDVGLETGNVIHPKGVRVQGNVLEGGEIDAGESIEIAGMVERSDIVSGGDITVGGGIIGDVDSAVRAEGGVQAKFIIETKVEAKGPVVAENEITNSIVRTRGSVSMPQGRVVGGVTMALGGIEVGESGSAGFLPTILIAAEDFTLIEKLVPLRGRIEKFEKVLKVLNKKFAPLKGRREELPEALRPTYDSMAEKVGELEENIEDIRAEIKRIEAPSLEIANPTIVVNEKVYPETTFRIMLRETTVHDMMIGPVRVTLDEEGQLHMTVPEGTEIEGSATGEDGASEESAADGEEQAREKVEEPSVS